MSMVNLDGYAFNGNEMAETVPSCMDSGVAAMRAKMTGAAYDDLQFVDGNPMLKKTCDANADDMLEAPLTYIDGNEAEEQHAPSISARSARSIMSTEFEPLHWFVENFIAPGATLAVGAPKVGKSWLILDLAISVARGSDFLGKSTNKSPVLYLALEDSERRIKSRMSTYGIAADEVPELLEIATKAPRLDQGLLQAIDAWINAHGGKHCLIIIDVFQKVRGITKKGANVYEIDSEVMYRLNEYAHGKESSIILVHHTNKSTASEDWFSRISGSQGLAGAVDMVFYLDRERDSSFGTIHFDARDAWGNDFVIHFDKGRWSMYSEDVDSYRTMCEYESNAVLIRCCRRVMEKYPGGHDFAKEELLDLFNGWVGSGQLQIPSTTKLTQAFNSIATKLRETEGIDINTGAWCGKQKVYRFSRVKAESSIEPMFT